MQIKWYGQSCFQIIAQQDKSEKINIVIDPLEEGLGLRAPSLKADILLVTGRSSGRNDASPVKNNPFIIAGPGEYEVRGVFVRGIPALCSSKEGGEKGTITCFTVEAEEIQLCHLGQFGQKELTDEQLEKIGEVDILMIPVGGGSAIDEPTAQKIIAQIEPKIVIPMRYKIPGLKTEDSAENADKFLKIMGRKAVETQEKLVVKKKDLSEEEGTKIVILKP